MIEPGQQAPDFNLEDQGGGHVRLSDLRGRPVVLFFYPRAGTSGCTTQACGIRDRSAEYASHNARVIGISPDPVEAIKDFADEQSLDFTLLSDADHAVAEAYGAWGERSMYGNKFMGIILSTWVIDPMGTVSAVFPKVQPKKHDDLVLKALGDLDPAAPA